MKDKRRAIAASIGLVMVALLGSQAFGANSAVTLVTVSGSRTFTPKTLSGDGLTALSMGSGRQAPFVVNVSDVAYDRKAYQVTAMMSDLYPFNTTTGEFDCSGASVSASKASIGFVETPISVRNVEAAVEPFSNFQGTITDPALLASLGLSQPTAITVRSKQNMQTFAKKGAHYGHENTLPIKVLETPGGAFAAAAPHSDCDPSASGATSISLQDGTVNTAAEVLEWVKSSADELFVILAGPDGMLSISEAVTAGILTQPSVDADVREALISPPINVDPLLVTESAISQVSVLLSAVESEVTSIVRQTGSYTSLPILKFGDLSGMPTGTYRGTLTLTLIDL